MHESNGGIWVDKRGCGTWYWRRTVNGKRKLMRIGTFKEFPTKAKAQRHAWQIIIPEFRKEQESMNGEPQPKRTIDERLDAIAMNLELASRMAQATDERLNKLTATVEKHEQEWERFRRAMRAALAEWFSDNGDGEEGTN